MSNYLKKITILFSLVIIISYFLGFYFNENSIGSGGYQGDLVWIWKNFEIFKNEELTQAIKSKDFFGNRSPLLYILNVYLNPFINNIDTYRLSTTLFSLAAPLILFFCLKEKFQNLKEEFIILFSLLILLSPFYRSSAYWGMEIQYGIITSLLSIFFLLKNNKLKESSYRYIFLSTFFSSITIYFDLKLVIIPLFVFFKIILSNENYKKKIFMIFNFLIFSIPYLFLIVLWDGLVPQATQDSNPLQITHLSNSKLHLVNILFATNIMGFYLFPLVILKKNIFQDIKKFPNFFNGFLLLLFIIYILSFINYDLYDYVDTFTRERGGYKDFWGLGYSAKLSSIIFNDRNLSLFFNVIIYLSSIFIILLFISCNLINLYLIIFFYLISIALFPLMQEYFDPYILILGLLLSNNKYEFNFTRCSLVFLYFSTFLVSSIIFYF